MHNSLAITHCEVACHRQWTWQYCHGATYKYCTPLPLEPSCLHPVRQPSIIYFLSHLFIINIASLTLMSCVHTIITIQIMLMLHSIIIYGQMNNIHIYIEIMLLMMYSLLCVGRCVLYIQGYIPVMKRFWQPHSLLPSPPTKPLHNDLCLYIL